jgi:cell division protein FtsZ
MPLDVQQADLAFEEPEPVAAAPAAPEPVVQAPAPRTVIVDPLVAEDEDFDAPLYAEPFTDSRQQRKGFLSLFGGRPQQQQPRFEGGMPRATGRASTAAQPIEEPQVDESEDLEIPSFLRRLAN